MTWKTWGVLSISAGVLSALLISLWSYAIGNDVLDNAVGSFLGVFLAFLSVGIINLNREK